MDQTFHHTCAYGPWSCLSAPKICSSTPMAAQLTRIEIFVVVRARLNEWIDLQLV
jgi:hypothetical protein